MNKYTPDGKLLESLYFFSGALGDSILKLILLVDLRDNFRDIIPSVQYLSPESELVRNYAGVIT